MKNPHFCWIHRGDLGSSKLAWAGEGRATWADPLIGLNLGGDWDGLWLVLGLHGERWGAAGTGNVHRVLLKCYRSSLGLNSHYLRLGSLTVTDKWVYEFRISWNIMLRSEISWKSLNNIKAPFEAHIMKYYPRPGKSSEEGTLPLSLPSDWSLIPPGTSTKSCWIWENHSIRVPYS